jgi:hypothetical protein
MIYIYMCVCYVHIYIYIYTPLATHSLRLPFLSPFARPSLAVVRSGGRVRAAATQHSGGLDLNKSSGGKARHRFLSLTTDPVAMKLGSASSPSPQI